MLAACLARITRSKASLIGVRFVNTVICVVKYGGGSSGCIISRVTCGFTGGKNETICGVGGREIVGICAKEESAAEDDEDEMAERVRWRIGRPDSFKTDGTGRVETDRAEDTEVRRYEDGVFGDEGDIGVVLELGGGVGIAIPPVACAP